MRRRTGYLAAGALAVLGVAAQSTDYASAAPIFQHKPAASFGQATCLPSGVWQATLVVTADVPGGTANLAPAGATDFDKPMPVSNVFSIAPSVTDYPVTVTASWPDGFVAAPITVVAHRPAEGCTPPTTVAGVTTTTTCTEAIPPRDDCEVPTSPTTTPPSPSTTTVASSSSVPPVGTAVVRSTPSIVPSSTPKITTGALPATGASDTGLLIVIVGAFTAGVALLVLGQRPA
jgi:hypothetical protein